MMPLHLHVNQKPDYDDMRERSGSVVECLTQDQRAAGSSITAFCP